MKNIAIIGAGLSGLTVATKLKNHANIMIFEKARGVGGRMSHRRAEPFYFDHGAQFFRVKTDEFDNFIKPMLKKNLISKWNARFVEFDGNKVLSRREWSDDNPHYVGVPGMNAIAKYLAKDLSVNLQTRITQLQKNDNEVKWNLVDENGKVFENFDWVICTTPAEQAFELLPQNFKYYQDVSSTKMLACFSLMLGFEEKLPIDFDAALVKSADISWISVNSSKPGREGDFSLLINSTNKWAEDHMDDEKEAVMEYLCAETSKIIGCDISSAKHKSLHAWRFANVDSKKTKKVLIDHKQNLATCGDWCIKGRVEAAFISGLDVANCLLEVIK